MAKKLGTIKSISGSAEVIAVDKSGNQRVLKVGDSLYEGETVKTTSADSKVVIATNNGKELSMIGEDTLSLDPKATAADSQVAALQKALLNGANLEDLEETAAGGNSGGRGDGMSLGETRFEHGGHYSNISASTSAINPLGATSFAGPAEGKSGGLDNGGTGGGTGFYIDTTAPVVTINSINPVDTNEKADGNPDKGIVKGHSDEPNAPVVVKDKDGKIIGSGTTDDKGNFEVTTDPIKPGDKVTVEVTDKAGNTGKGDGTAGNTVYTDTTPPTVDVTTVTPVDVNNPADGKADKGIVTGKSDEPNALVVITDKDGNEIGRGTTDGNGGFTIETKPFNPGDPITATVTDKAGNKGSDTENASNLTHPNDHTAPSEPTITFVEDTNPKDSKLNKAENGSDSDNANTTAKISIPTDAVVNDVIKYTVNGEEKSHPITDADKAKGHIEIKVPVVDGKTSTVTAKIVDQAGNASKEVSGNVDVDLTIGNPKVRFLEDTDNNGVLSVAEVAAIKDGKAHWVIDIPTDGSIKAGDVIQSIDSKGNWVKFVTITDEMIKDGRFEATFNVDIEKLRNGKYETPEYRFADDAGNISDSSKATLTLDSELTRQPSNPSITFPEDNDPKDGKISDKENKAGDNDAGKTTAEVVIPQDGSVKPGDKLIVTDDKGKETVRPIEQSDIDKGSIDVPVDLNPGKDNTIIAEIVNPNNPDNPGKGKGVIGENSEATKAPEAPVINEIIDDAKGYGEDTKVGNVLDVKGHLTNDNTPTIKGTAKAGSKVEIYDNGDRIGETTAKSDGSWEFEAPALTKQGEHKFTATAENKFGKSTPSNEATIDLDSIAPKLDNVKITPIDTNSKADDTAELTMGTGHTDTPNAEILFRDVDNNIIGKGHANSAGDFLIQLDKAVQPGTPVFVQAIDKAGNAGTEMATAGNIEHPNDHTVPKVNIDTVTPVDETNPSDGTPDKGIVKGKSDEPNAPVVVTDENGKTIGTGTTDDKGNFEITTDPIKPGDKVTVEVTDKAGHKGSDTETAGDTEFVDNTPPSVDVKEVTPVDTNNPADGNPDKGIVKGHSDEPNAPVVVKDKDGKIIGTGTTDDKGNFEITTDPIKPGDKVNVEVTDKAGNKGNGEGTAGNTDFTDKTAPDAPVITEVIDDVKGGKFNEDVKGGTTNDTTPTFKGTAEAGSTITLKNGNNIIAEKIPVKADGSWEFTPKSSLAEGEYSITATATDKAGNVSNASNVATVTIDLHTSKPVINEIIDNVEGDTGNVKNERIGWTNDNTPTLKGSAEAGATVDVYVDGRKAGSVKANEKGEWEYATSKLSDGKHSFYAIATDEAGNVSENSEISWIKVDTNPGQVVITRITDDNGDDVLNGSYEGATKDNTPTIWGTGEQYATVTVSVKDSSGKVVWSDEVYIEDSLGDWSITVDKPLNDGDYTVEASMQDYVKNPVQNSNVVSLTVDTATDIPEIKEIVDNVAGGVENGDVKGKVTNDNTPTLKGSAEAGADIKVFVDGKIAGTTKAGFDGSWEFTPRTKLSDGEHKFVVEATDKLGHSAKSIEASVDVDTTIGNPKVRFVEDTNNDGVLSVAEVAAIKDGKAHWVIDIPTDGSVKAGDVIQSIDGKGNWVKFVEITDEMIKDGRFEATFNVGINKLKDGKYETPEYRFADDAGNVSDSSKATLTLDSEFSRKPSNPEIKFPEDTNKDGKISDDENKANDKDAGKTTVEVTIPKDGSVKPGDKVVVTDDNGKKTEKPINQDDIDKGKIDIPVDLNPGKDNNVTAEIINPNNPNNPGKDSKVIGEASSTVKVTIDEIIDDVKGYGEDTKVGNVLDVKGHLTNDNLPTFKGSAAPGATVEIYESFYTTTEKTLVGKVTADANGKWSFTPTEAMSDGEHYFEAVATDKVGNKSTSDRVSLDVDTFADAPVIDAVNDNVDSQTGNVLDAKTKVALTNDSTPTLEGYAEPDSVITIYEISELNGDKKAIGTVTADNHGGWKFELPELGDGEYKYTTRAQDKAGNISDFSEVVVVNADLIAPSEPTITFVEDVNPKDGKLNKAENSKDGDSTSTKAQISVPGDAEENDVIHYTVNGEEKTHTITYNDRVTGYVEIKVPVVDGKASSVTAKIVDQAGNASKEVSGSVDVDIHIDAPVITAVTDNWWGGVENDGNVLGVNDGFTNDTTPTFKGKAEAGSTIVLKNGNDIIAEKVVVDSDGNWEFTPKSPLAEGEYNVVAIATDKAGNVSVPSNVATVNVDISTTQPVITEIIDDEAGGVVGNVKNALTNDNLPTLKGTAEAFSTVKIIVDDKLVFKDGKEVTVTADKDGNWEYTFEANLNWGGKVHAALEDGVHTLKVQTTDRAGNRSAVSEWSSVDVDKTIGIPKVKITTDTNGDKKIDIDDASALKDGKLKWVIEIPENTVKAGDRVQILGSDAKTWTDIFKVTAQDIAKGFIERDEFSIDMPKSRGFQTPSYRLVDDAGNVSEGSMDAVKIVGFAPKAPTIIAVLDNEYGIDPKDPISINAGDTTGNVLEGAIAITNDNTPTLMGKAEAGTTITLKKGNTVIADNIPVDANGSWHYEPEENSPWSDGDYEIKAIAKNVFGKESESSSPITVTVDTTKPEVTLTSIEDSVKTNDVVDFTGNVKDKFTNDNTPVLKGTAEAGSTIIIKYGEHHENEVTTKADKNGHWEYKITNPLSDGEHIISYQAVDKAGNTSLEYVANVTVDTKIADAKVEFIEDTNNDGKFSWKENIENPNIGRMAWKALIPDDGSIKAGDTFNYRWGASDSWHNRTITQADIDRGYIGEKVQNQYEQGQPNAGKPLAFGANANGRVYEAEAYFSDAAGNKGAKGSDKVVFDFGDNTDNKHIATTNVKITSIYDDVRGGHVGNLITNEAAQVAGLTNDKTPTISGTAEANASVKVSVVDSKSHSVWEKTITAESDGSWKVTTDDIADGNYSVTAVATNKAGAVSNPYTVSNLEIDTTIAQPNIWIKEDANQDKIYDKADYENPANGNGDITFVVDIPQDRVTIKAGDVFHYMINTNNPKWGNINGYTEDITITEADIKSGSISRVVTLCDDGKDFNMSHDGMIVSMNGYFKDLAGNALSNDTMVRFDLKNTYGGKVRSTRSLPDDILDNDSVDLSNAAHINEPKAELNVLNNNKIGVSANDLLETPKDHIMNEGKSEAKPSYATASSHAGEENIATTHPIQIEEKVESHF